jgi:hypothetical protein
MKLKRLLSKPAWQSADADRRREAVESAADAELVSLLPQLARGDPDARVRLAAARRLVDPGVAQAMAHDDADAATRAAAHALWLDILSGRLPGVPPPNERLRLLRGQDDAVCIEHVARHGAEAELRAAALARVGRVAVLAERAVADPDPVLRSAALERIDDERVLAQIAERTRKSDKQVTRLARTRLEALRIARNDDTTVANLARDLCERMERVIREPGAASAESAVAEQWQRLAGRAPPELVARYRNACQLLEASRRAPVSGADDPPKALMKEPAAAPPAAIAGPAGPPADDADNTTRLDALAASARFNASLAAAEAATLRERQARSEAARGAFEQALACFEQALDSGKATRAHAAHAELGELRKRIDGALPAQLGRRLEQAEQRHSEISRWQRWGDNRQRHRLCEDLRALAAAGLHPDAVATRVREARNEWARLDAMEGAARSRAAERMAGRFAALCREALEPARPYFDKRQALRQSRSQEIAALVARAQALPAEIDDWTALAALRREAAAALRDLDQVDPRERKSLAKAVKTALERIDALLDARHATIDQGKAALIAEAEGLAGRDARGLANGARALQQRWQALGKGRPRRDQSQWKAFRAAIDAAFARLDAERGEAAARSAAAREEAAARKAAARAQAEAICDEFEARLAEAKPPPRTDIAALEARWRVLDVAEAALARRFSAAQASWREAVATLARRERRARFDAWLARYRVCREAETGSADADTLHARWAQCGGDNVAAAELDGRYTQALEARHATGTDADAEAARDLLVRLEMLGGLASPVEDRQRRLDLQVARLSAHLRGAAPAGIVPEIEALLADWSRLRPRSSEAAALDARLERALEAVLAALP